MHRFAPLLLPLRVLRALPPLRAFSGLTAAASAPGAPAATPAPPPLVPVGETLRAMGRHAPAWGLFVSALATGISMVYFLAQKDAALAEKLAAKDAALAEKLSVQFAELHKLLAEKDVLLEQTKASVHAKLLDFLTTGDFAPLREMLKAKSGAAAR
jgi:hypothetical protein